ncbi:MAG: class I SAM-dependent methyltransferase [Candidatus Altiarchaeota archaeon]|nr:class I SAM-dependent methyltransferase [Candidatus Altiarchaeota archaeon]
MRGKQEKDWGKMADKFDENTRYVVGEAICEEISERVSKEGNLSNVIEFGCGTGYFTKTIIKNARYVTATDISDDMLEMAKNQLKGCGNITFKRADCKSNGFPDKEFDTVFMANLLHVIKNPSCALEESCRILKPGGLLITVDLTGYGMKKFEMLKLGFRYVRKIGKPPKADKGNLSPDDLESLAGNAGFRIEEIELLGDKLKAVYFKGVKK